MTYNECRVILDIDNSFASFEGGSSETGGMIGFLNRIVNILNVKENDDNLKIKGIVDLFNTIINDVQVFKNKPNEEESDENLHDLRILDAYVHNFKTYPNEKFRRYGIKLYDINNDENAHVIRTEQKPKPHSLFAIGSNGSGKSSMYGALEWKCTKNIGEGKLRKESLTHYGRNVYSSDEISDNSIQIKTVSGKTDFEKYPLDIFFCSEKDLIDMLQNMPHDNDKDWTRFFTDIIGYRILNDLISKIDDLLRLGQESESYSKIVLKSDIPYYKIYQDAQYIVEKNSLKKHASELTVIKNLEYSIKNLKTIKNIVSANPINESRLQKLITRLNRKLKFIDRYELTFGKIRENLQGLNKLLKTKEEENKIPLGNVDKIDNPGIEMSITLIDRLEEEIIQVKTEITEFSNNKNTDQIQIKEDVHFVLDNILTDDTNQSFVKIKELNEQIITLKKIIFDRRKILVNEIFTNEFCNKFQNWFSDTEFMEAHESLIIDTSSDSILFYTRLKKESYHEHDTMVDNNVYYNTFRLKLIALMLRAEVAISIMKRDNFRFPIIMDDIFYSSDYENKFMLKYFFTALHDRARENFGDPDQLQMILFTHDEQILNVSRLATVEANIKAIIARFCHHSYVLDSEPVFSHKKNNYYNLLVAL